jgi:hypothetical protein
VGAIIWRLDELFALNASAPAGLLLCCDESQSHCDFATALSALASGSRLLRGLVVRRKPIAATAKWLLLLAETLCAECRMKRRSRPFSENDPADNWSLLSDLNAAREPATPRFFVTADRACLDWQENGHQQKRALDGKAWVGGKRHAAATSASSSFCPAAGDRRFPSLHPSSEAKRRQTLTAQYFP